MNDVYDSAAMAFTGAALTGTMNWEAGSGVCVVNIDNDRVLVAGGDSLMVGMMPVIYVTMESFSPYLSLFRTVPESTTMLPEPLPKLPP